MTQVRGAGVGGLVTPIDVEDGGDVDGVDGDIRVCATAGVGSGCVLAFRAPSAAECGYMP